MTKTADNFTISRVPKLLAILATLVAALALLSPTSAKAEPWGTPDLGADPYYAALVNYVNWLQQRKSTSATSAQKQGFRDTLARLNQDALWEMGQRHNTRLAVSWSWNRSGLSNEVAGLKRAMDADVATYQQQFNAAVAEAKKEKDAAVAELTKQNQADIQDIKANCADDSSSASGEWNGQITDAKRGVAKNQKRFNKAKHKFGKKSSKARKAKRVLNNSKKSLARLEAQRSSAVSEVTTDCQEQISVAQGALAEEIGGLEEEYKATVSELAGERDGNIQDRSSQYNDEAAGAQENWDDAWGTTVGDLEAHYNNERNACTNQRDRGLQYISATPTK